MRDAQSSQFQMLFRLSKKHLESGIISDVQPSGASQPAIVEFREIENSWTDVIKDLNCQQHPQQPHWWILSPSITYRVMSLSLSLFVSCQPQTPTFLHQQDVATKRATPNQLVPAHWRRPDVPDSPNHVLRPWIVLCARTVRDLFPLFSDFIRFKCVYMYVYIVYIICFIYHTYESHSNLCQPTTEATLLGGVYTFYGGEMFQQSTGILVWQDWLGAALANVCWRKKRDKLHVLQLELVHGL